MYTHRNLHRYVLHARLRHVCRIAALLGCLLLCVSCTARQNTDAALRSALHSGFAEYPVQTPDYKLFAMLRGAKERSRLLFVYIEGDGHAWKSRTRPSSDPTPLNPVALRMAQADTGTDAVLYLARPCQYVSDPQCNVHVWTDARLSEKVVRSLNSAVDAAKQRVGADRVALIGYSGGGGAAALLAERRSDVVFLGSAAGCLDTVAWTRKLGVSPLARSLNPIDAASSLASVPQLHLLGAQDGTVPPEIGEAFCRRAGGARLCRRVPDMRHGGEWEKVWPYDEIRGMLGRAE